MTLEGIFNEEKTVRSEVFENNDSSFSPIFEENKTKNIQEKISIINH